MLIGWYRRCQRFQYIDIDIINAKIIATAPIITHPSPESSSDLSVRSSSSTLSPTQLVLSLSTIIITSLLLRIFGLNAQSSRMLKEDITYDDTAPYHGCIHINTIIYNHIPSI